MLSAIIGWILRRRVLSYLSSNVTFSHLLVGRVQKDNSCLLCAQPNTFTPSTFTPSTFTPSTFTPAMTGTCMLIALMPFKKLLLIKNTPLESRRVLNCKISEFKH